MNRVNTAASSPCGHRPSRTAATMGAVGGGLLLLMGAALGAGCDSSSGGAVPGDACTEADHDVDRELCSGSNVIECKLDAATEAYRWQVKKDCADTDRVCVSGDCTTPTSSCLAVAGAWTVTQHCVASEIGQTYTVVQTGCEFVVNEAGWAGQVDAQGGLSMGGPAGPGVTMTCAGSVTTSALAVECTPSCHVEMTR